MNHQTPRHGEWQKFENCNGVNHGGTGTRRKTEKLWELLYASGSGRDARGS